MKSIVTSVIVSIAALSSCSLAVVTMNVSKNPAPGIKLGNRVYAARKEFDALLDHEVNDILTSNYIINVQVGSPPQDIALAIDTGSSDVWVLDSSTSICADEFSLSRAICRTPFYHANSTSFKVSHKDAFDITYADGTSARGDYFTDNLQLDGVTVKAQTMGIAYKSTLAPGLLGIGYSDNEASLFGDNPFKYPSIIESLQSQGKINTKAYSLYLDDLGASTGSLLFGGLDSDKYQGNLVQMPVIPEDLGFGETIYASFSVPMVGMEIFTSNLRRPAELAGVPATGAPMLLDSGTTLSYISPNLYKSILQELEGEEDPVSGFAFVECSVRDRNPRLNFNFKFGLDETIVIRVPGAEMIYDMEPIFGRQKADVSLKDPCMLGFLSQARPPYVLGDNFLRSAYVVYDLKNNLIALGQTNFDSTTSSIIDIPADATTIPVRSGVATHAVTEPTQRTTKTTASGFSTMSGRIGTQSADGGPALPTITDDAENPNGSKNPAVVSRPLELGGLAVLGMSMVFTLVGGGLFLTF